MCTQLLASQLSVRYHSHALNCSQTHVKQCCMCVLQLSWSRARPEWRSVFGGEPHSVGSLHMSNFSVVDDMPIDIGHHNGLLSLQSGLHSHDQLSAVT